MKTIFIGLLLLSLSNISCKEQSTLPKSSVIIRNNFFDSNIYRLNLVDTNKVNRMLYESIFKQIKFEDSAKCLLVENHFDNVVRQEFGLYNYKTGRFFYTSTDKGLYLFDSIGSQKEKEMYKRVMALISEPNMIKNNVIYCFNKKKNKFGFGNIHASQISVNGKTNLVKVDSYYW